MKDLTMAKIRHRHGFERGNVPGCLGQKLSRQGPESGKIWFTGAAQIFSGGDRIPIQGSGTFLRSPT